jgi:hypothetical protein
MINQTGIILIIAAVVLCIVATPILIHLYRHSEKLKKIEVGRDRDNRIYRSGRNNHYANIAQKGHNARNANYQNYKRTRSK